MVMMHSMITTCVVALLLIVASNAFSVPHKSIVDTRGRFRTERKASLLDVPSVIESTSSLTLAEDSWRQYVPLVVIAGVLVDILLGSPLANSALKPLKGDEPGAPVDGAEEEKSAMNRARERIDSESVAQAAIDKAQSTLELRRFLDESKTDWDRMEDMKRKLDSEMQDLDEDLATREESLKKRRD